MTTGELALRLHRALRDYTAETALCLEDTDALSVFIHPVDWRDILADAARSTWVSQDQDSMAIRFMGIRVERHPSVPIGQPYLTSFWEKEL